LLREPDHIVRATIFAAFVLVLMGRQGPARRCIPVERLFGETVAFVKFSIGQVKQVGNTLAVCPDCYLILLHQPSFFVAGHTC